MYRVNGFRFCVNIMDCTRVIVVTYLCVPYFKQWMIAQVFAYTKNSVILIVYNCNWKYMYGIIVFVFVRYFVFDHLNIFDCYYFSRGPLLLISIFNHTLWNILTLINCNIVPHSYFHHVLSLHFLYTHLQNYKYRWTVYVAKIDTTFREQRKVYRD